MFCVHLGANRSFLHTEQVLVKFWLCFFKTNWLRPLGSVHSRAHDCVTDPARSGWNVFHESRHVMGRGSSYGKKSNWNETLHERCKRSRHDQASGIIENPNTP